MDIELAEMQNDTLVIGSRLFPIAGNQEKIDTILPKQAQVSKLLEPALRIHTFVRNGWALYVYYLPEDVQLDVNYFGLNLAVIADEAPKALEQPVLIDLLSGVVYEVAKGASPHLFTALPLTDYPLILADRRALGDRIVRSFHA